MFKKSLSTLLIIFIIFSLTPVATVAKDSEFVINDGVLVRYNGFGGDVVVPDGVKSIGESAFANFASVNSVILPNSVTSIGKSAFSRCINLISITIPDSVTEINDYAFELCKSLPAISISEYVKTIGISVFANCQSLSEININENNRHYSSVNGVMFDKNKSTLLIYPAGKKDSFYAIPGGVTKIEAKVFDYCEKLTSIMIPDSVKSIGNHAFSGTGLTSVTLPDSITIIEDYTFSFCYRLTSVTLPDSLTHIGNSAFQSCHSLTSITIPDSVVSIGYLAFSFCSLISVTIPNSVTSIDYAAFSSSPSLISIIIPESVESMGNDVFFASDNVVIYGIKDSYAHKYARDHYLKFAEISDQSSVTQTQRPPADTTFNPSVILNKLGLFNGVGTDSQDNPIFDLEREPTRQEALVMLIRLLGLEKSALASKEKHPFDDVASWADPYVGYAYSVGLTNGISRNKFGGSDLATLQQYSVFLLRALGYSEKDDDFIYSNALDKALELGIISSKDGNSFTRGDVAELSYNTLLLSPKGEAEKLANKLLWSDVFTIDQLDSTRDGELMLAADMPDSISDGVIVYNLEDLRDLIYLAMRNNQLGLGVNVPGFSGEQLSAVYDDIIKDYHLKAILSPEVTSWSNYIYTKIHLSTYLMLEYYYENPGRYQKNYQFYRTELIEYSGMTVSFAGWVYKVDGIIDENTKPSMTQTEKVKALHDYLVLNTMYDRAAEGKLTASPHFASQIIFDGYGVCDGYSEAFKILMNAAGIECKVIYGRTHAWNQVKIDGIWYNMDVTWDDLDDGDKISYDYFCVSDEKFLKDHQAEEICKPEKCPYTLKLN